MSYRKLETVLFALAVDTKPVEVNGTDFTQTGRKSLTDKCVDRRRIKLMTVCD